MSGINCYPSLGKGRQRKQLAQISDGRHAKVATVFDNPDKRVVGHTHAMADTIETYRTVTPYLVVADADAEIRFLESAFGATVTTNQRNSDGRVMHAELAVGNSLVMLGQAGDQWKPLSAALYIWVPDCDATYQRAIAAGAVSESAPEDKPYGHRNAGVVDQNGITWWIGSPITPP